MGGVSETCFLNKLWEAAVVELAIKLSCLVKFAQSPRGKHQGVFGLLLLVTSFSFFHLISLRLDKLETKGGVFRKTCIIHFTLY